MKNIKKQKRLLILGFLIAVALMNIPALYTNYYHEITGAPSVKGGVVDLSGENLEKDKVYMSGEWQFYWKRLIITEYAGQKEPDLIINVPDQWSKYKIQGQRLTAAGYGSYKIKIENLNYSQAITMYLPDFGGAYKVYIDGKLTAKSGSVSKDKKDVFTTPKANLYPVTVSPGSHEAVIEVATTRFSGLYMAPVLCDFSNAIEEGENREAASFIIFGISLCAFASLVAMYVGSIRKKFRFFWMPLMVLFILLRMMITGEAYSFWQPLLFFNLSYEASNEFMYITTFALKYFLIFLVEEQCGIEITKNEKIGFLGYYVFLYLIYIVSPNEVYNNYLSVIIPMLTYALEIYLFIKIYKNAHKLYKFGITIFFGAIIVIVGVTLGSYYINGKIYYNMSIVLPALFTIFTIILCWVFAKRIIDLYDDFNQSSSQLILAKNQIIMQKEYYKTLSNQMNEIREMKHDVKHFIGSMKRLAEENKFQELGNFIAEYGEKTEMDKLPVFCENIVANSIIGYYYLRAKEADLNFESNCSIDLETSISDSDICVILGNALENAVEACKKIKHNDRYLEIEACTVNDQWLLKVTNSYGGELKIEEGRLGSLKQEKSHGLGLKNIEKVAENYNGFIKLDYNDKEFVIMVALQQSK